MPALTFGALSARPLKLNRPRTTGTGPSDCCRTILSAEHLLQRPKLLPHILENLTRLQGSASAVTHVHEPIEDAKHALRQLRRQRLRALGESMNKRGDAAWNYRAVPSNRHTRLLSAICPAKTSGG